MILFTNLKNVWGISCRGFLISFSAFTKGLQRLLAYSCFGFVIFLIALTGINCGSDNKKQTYGSPPPDDIPLPTKPTLRATARDGIVHLFWNRLEDTSSYRVYMNETNTCGDVRQQ